MNNIEVVRKGFKNLITVPDAELENWIAPNAAGAVVSRRPGGRGVPRNKPPLSHWLVISSMISKQKTRQQLGSRSAVPSVWVKTLIEGPMATIGQERWLPTTSTKQSTTKIIADVILEGAVYTADKTRMIRAGSITGIKDMWSDTVASTIDAVKVHYDKWIEWVSNPVSLVVYKPEIEPLRKLADSTLSVRGKTEAAGELKWHYKTVTSSKQLIVGWIAETMLNKKIDDMSSRDKARVADIYASLFTSRCEHWKILDKWKRWKQGLAQDDIWPAVQSITKKTDAGYKCVKCSIIVICRHDFDEEACAVVSGRETLCRFCGAVLGVVEDESIDVDEMAVDLDIEDEMKLFYPLLQFIEGDGSTWLKVIVKSIKPKLGEIKDRLEKSRTVQAEQQKAMYRVWILIWGVALIVHLATSKSGLRMRDIETSSVPEMLRAAWAKMLLSLNLASVRMSDSTAKKEFVMAYKEFTGWKHIEKPTKKKAYDYSQITIDPAYRPVWNELVKKYIGKIDRFTKIRVMTDFAVDLAKGKVPDNAVIKEWLTKIWNVEYITGYSVIDPDEVKHDLPEKLTWLTKPDRWRCPTVKRGVLEAVGNLTPVKRCSMALGTDNALRRDIVPVKTGTREVINSIMVNNMKTYWRKKCPAKVGFHGDKCDDCGLGSPDWGSRWLPQYKLEKSDVIIDQVIQKSKTITHPSWLTEWSYNFADIVKLSEKLQVSTNVITCIGNTENVPYADVLAGTYNSGEPDNKWNQVVFALDGYVRLYFWLWTRYKNYYKLVKHPAILANLKNVPSAEKMNEIPAYPGPVNPIDYNAGFHWAVRYFKPREAIQYVNWILTNIILSTYDTELGKAIWNKIRQSEEMLSAPGTFDRTLLWEGSKKKEEYDEPEGTEIKQPTMQTEMDTKRDVSVHEYYDVDDEADVDEEPIQLRSDQD